MRITALLYNSKGYCQHCCSVSFVSKEASDNDLVPRVLFFATSSTVRYLGPMQTFVRVIA